jgi:hypothetical protein
MDFQLNIMGLLLLETIYRVSMNGCIRGPDRPTRPVALDDFSEMKRQIKFFPNGPFPSALALSFAKPSCGTIIVISRHCVQAGFVHGDYQSKKAHSADCRGFISFHVARACPD